MSENKYTGTAEIELAGETYQIRFDWSALAQIATEFGIDSIGSLHSISADKVAKILSIGIGKLTPKQIMEISPPLHHTIQKIDYAIAIAYFGPEDTKRLAEVVEGAKKKQTATE
jgi:hypothetical protein